MSFETFIDIIYVSFVRIKFIYSSMYQTYGKFIPDFSILQIKLAIFQNKLAILQIKLTVSVFQFLSFENNLKYNKIYFNLTN